MVNYLFEALAVSQKHHEKYNPNVINMLHAISMTIFFS